MENDNNYIQTDKRNEYVLEVIMRVVGMFTTFYLFCRRKRKRVKERERERESKKTKNETLRM